MLVSSKSHELVIDLDNQLGTFSNDVIITLLLVLNVVDNTTQQRQMVYMSSCNRLIEGP